MLDSCQELSHRDVRVRCSYLQEKLCENNRRAPEATDLRWVQRPGLPPLQREQSRIFGNSGKIEYIAEVSCPPTPVAGSNLIRLPDPFHPCAAVSLKFRVVAMNPLSFPIGGLQKAHLPPRGFTQRRRSAIRIPDPNSPVVAMAGCSGGPP